MVRSIVNLAVLGLALFLAYLLFWPLSVAPEAYEPGPDPGREGPHAENGRLSAAEFLGAGMGIGPEDTTIGGPGGDWLYAGLADGRILRIPDRGAGEAALFAQTGGRPLGMEFDAAGNLIVADAGRGLLSIAPSGEISVLVDSFGGEPLLFVDDLAIAADGTIWFSDASLRFRYGEEILDIVEASRTGRLFAHDPRTGETTLALDGLYFANGVALGPEDAFVLVNETGAARITRLWLDGPKAGLSDIFAENLPVLPDNLSYNGEGVFWVAGVTPRIPILDRLHSWPFLKAAMLRLPEALWPGIEPYGWVIGLDLDGRAVADLQDPTARVHAVTSVNQHDGKLYLGSLAMDAVARIAVPDGLRPGAASR